jgi:hypothetical protein
MNDPLQKFEANKWERRSIAISAAALALQFLIAVALDRFGLLFVELGQFGSPG